MLWPVVVPMTKSGGVGVVFATEEKSLKRPHEVTFTLSDEMEGCTTTIGEKQKDQYVTMCNDYQQECDRLESTVTTACCVVVLRLLNVQWPEPSRNLRRKERQSASEGGR